MFRTSARPAYVRSRLVLPPGATALPLDFLRPYQGFGNNTYIEPASSSNHHSLQTSFNRRFTKGLLLGVTHTGS